MEPWSVNAAGEHVNIHTCPTGVIIETYIGTDGDGYTYIIRRDGADHHKVVNRRAVCTVVEAKREVRRMNSAADAYYL